MSATGDRGGASEAVATPRGVAAGRRFGLPGQVVARLAGRLGVQRRELGWLGAIILVAAILRFVDLPARGGWDLDQATSMEDLQHAIQTLQLPTFGPLSSLLTFHHGALYYDLLLPADWLGNGDPTWIVAEIALLSLILIPGVWWIARTIGGAAAGLTAAFLAAISAGMIGYATFIWNPTMIEPGAAIAYLGAWQALRTARPGWWLLAAAGSAVTAQAHVAAGVIVLPILAAYVFDVWRGPAERRRSVAFWGAAGVALFVATYLPLIVYEIGHGFPESRGILAYFTGGGSTTSTAPPVRLIFAAIRILAWPLTRWPLIDLESAFLPALLVASAIIALMVWLVGVTARPATRSAAATAADPAPRSAAAMAPRWAGPAQPAAPARSPDASDAQPDGSVSPEVARFGVRVVGAWLLLVILVLGLGLHSVSEVQELPTEQYHAMADPLVFVAAGLIAGALWQRLPRSRVTLMRRGAVLAGVALLVAWNVAHWPPLTSPDGGWPAAQAAAARLERDSGTSSMALVPLFEPKGIDAYSYPLSRDGRRLVAPDDAAVVVLLCDTFWLDGCGGKAEAAWVAGNSAAGGLTQVRSILRRPGSAAHRLQTSTLAGNATTLVVAPRGAAGELLSWPRDPCVRAAAAAGPSGAPRPDLRAPPTSAAYPGARP